MQTATSIPAERTELLDPAELPSMLATLCSYENWFGPHHLQTLQLTLQVAIACWHAGEPQARPLLERVVRDLGRYLGADHELRLRAVAALRDFFAAERAASLQKELLECRVQRLGNDDPETIAARADLARLLRILLEQAALDA